MISANQVAVALTAACRETGEDPIACATSSLGTSYRARHYAMWALIHVFKGEKPGYVGALVGAASPGDYKRGSQFYNNSRNNALPNRRPGGGGWWVADAYTRVIEAIEKTLPAPTPKPAPIIQNSIPATPAPYKHGELPPVANSVPSKEPQAIGTLEPGGFRPAPGTYEKALAEDRDDDSVFDRGSIASKVARRQVYAPPKSKREMADDLRRAVENTAAKTPRPEPGDSGN